MYSDDPTYFLEAYRRLEPIAAPDAELRFLQAAEALFMKGADFLADRAIGQPNSRLMLMCRLKCRVASWIGPRDPSCDCCFESPHRRYPQVFR